MTASLKLIAPKEGVFDEMLEAGALTPREHYRPYAEWLAASSAEAMAAKRAQADLIFRRIGITFSVYGDESGTERLIPSDVVPRIITATEWARLERGLIQRVTAINRFLADIYGPQEILRAGLIPEDQILANDQYQVAMIGMKVPHDIYAHIVGVDIVRHNDGEYYVLEDNLRVPSGVSYMLSNRKMMMRLFPDLFRRYRVRPVEHYPAMLLRTLRSAAVVDDPVAEILLDVGGLPCQVFDTIDHRHAQMKAIQLVHNRHVKGRGCGAFLAVAMHMEIIMVGTAVNQAMDQPGITMVGKDNRFTRGKQEIKLAIIQPMGVFAG